MINGIYPFRNYGASSFAANPDNMGEMVVKYLLVVMLLGGGVHTVPDIYPNKETCESVGQLLEISYTKVRGSNSIAAQCVPQFKE